MIKCHGWRKNELFREFMIVFYYYFYNNSRSLKKKKKNAILVKKKTVTKIKKNFLLMKDYCLENFYDRF